MSGNNGNKPQRSEEIYKLVKSELELERVSLLREGFVEETAVAIAEAFPYHPDFMRGLEKVNLVLEGDEKIDNLPPPICEPWAGMWQGIKDYQAKYPHGNKLYGGMLDALDDVSNPKLFIMAED